MNRIAICLTILLTCIALTIPVFASTSSENLLVGGTIPAYVVDDNEDFASDDRDWVLIPDTSIIADSILDETETIQKLDRLIRDCSLVSVIGTGFCLVGIVVTGAAAFWLKRATGLSMRALILCIIIMLTIFVVPEVCMIGLINSIMDLLANAAIVFG